MTIDIADYDMQAIGELAERELYRREILARHDVLSWGKYYFPDKFKLPFCELHHYIASIYNEPKTNTIAPRGHAKTTVQCFLIPTYLALNEPDLYHHYLNVQSTATKAQNVNIDIRRELESNPLIHQDYGDLVAPEKWTEKQFVLNNGVIFTAVGAGEGMRGINYRNKRPDFIIVDDLYDDDVRNSRTQIEKIENWLLSTLYPMRSKMKNSVFHLQGTVANKIDLLHKFQTDNTVKSRVFKAITDDAKKQVLWRELNDYDALMAEKKFIGSTNFAREYQGEVRDDESNIIKASWIKYARSIPEGHKIERVKWGVDPSIGASETSDFTGIAITYQTLYEGSKYYFITYAKGVRLSMQMRIKTLVDLAPLYPPHQCKVESIAGFKDFTAELRRQTNLPIVEITRVKDKITNLERVAPLFENGKVFIMTSMPEADRIELIDQLINNTPNYDDVRDAVILTLTDDKSPMRIGVI